MLCEKTHSKDAIALFKKLGYTYFGIYNYKKENYIIIFIRKV